MRICYLGDAGSIHVIRWCRHFAELGHEVHLITFSDQMSDDVTTHFVDVGRIAVAGGNWRTILGIPRVRALVREIQPDVLHALYATTYGLTGALTKCHPYVVTALGSDVLVSPNESRLYRMIVRYALRSADWVTAMAEHMRRAIIDLGVPGERVTTVPFGIDSRIFNDDGRLDRSGPLVITSTRNFESVYRIEDVVSAVADARHDLGEIEFLLIGDGSLREAIENQVRGAGLSELTKFFGRVRPEEVADVLRRTDVFISASSSDGNNVSLNEAMACGASCIASAIPANQQWLTHDVNGWLFAVGDVEGLSSCIRVAATQDHDDVLRRRSQNAEIVLARANWASNMAPVVARYASLARMNDL
jgi:L-malate glycosyltransferase